MMTRRKKRLAFLQKNRRINRRIKRVTEICQKNYRRRLEDQTKFFHDIHNSCTYQIPKFMIYTKISVFDFVIYSGKKIIRNSRNRRDFAEIYDFFVILSFFAITFRKTCILRNVICIPFRRFLFAFFRLSATPSTFVALYAASIYSRNIENLPFSCLRTSRASNAPRSCSL